MAFERAWKGLLVIIALLLGGFLAVQAGIVSAPWAADQATVHVLDADDEPKATVEAEIADSATERYTGLSDHNSLESGEGMLFVHASEGEQTYVMREMEFDIDIIFVGADHEITSIEHARAPESGEDGEDIQYTGQAKWVLEVPRGYATETGIEVGDRMVIDEE
ncbi:DUF192 domain-containing protein [Natrialba taiwanensis]|uniref:DUF192 domain-containing protein n=1 Tax=Natrialba taiwanensis DSM 12281 TaxID=1230458 RepID=L9ZV16_9EURY|nr:DUF192 domain-containing protein [Natrialba taiwanensis]ELY89926.1 hypothetical protein C484_13026 [Natrialba taiwanensis DSM 12281]